MAIIGWCSTEKPALFTWPFHVWDSRVQGLFPFTARRLPSATVSLRVPFLFPLISICFFSLLSTWIQLPEEQVAHTVCFMSRLGSFLMLCNKLLLLNGIMSVWFYFIFLFSIWFTNSLNSFTEWRGYILTLNRLGKESWCSYGWLTGRALPLIRCNISLVYRQTSSDLHQQQLFSSKTWACAEMFVLNPCSLTQTKILNNRLGKAFYGEEVDGSSFTPHTVRWACSYCC